MIDRTIRLPTSRLLLVRAQRRIIQLAERNDLQTTDPLRAEIELAHTYATMALAQSINEIKEEIRGNIKIDYTKRTTSDDTIRDIEKAIRDLRDRLAKLEQPTEPKPQAPFTPPPWWRRITR